MNKDVSGVLRLGYVQTVEDRSKSCVRDEKSCIRLHITTLAKLCVTLVSECDVCPTMVPCTRRCRTKGRQVQCTRRHVEVELPV
jgi:hypothetical protein